MFQYLLFAITPRSYIWQSFYINSLANLIKKQDKLVDTQGLAKRFNIKSNKTFTMAFTSLKTSTLLFIYLSTNDLFTQFIIYLSLN